MLKTFAYSFLLCFLHNYTFAQKVSNIKAELDKINRQIIVSYDLAHTQSKFDKYVVELYLSVDSGRTFGKEKLLYVSGDVGKGKTEGIDKKIQWFYLNEDGSFEGKGVVFKVKSYLDDDAYEKRLAKLKQESAVFYSLLVPGLGDYKVRSGKGYWWITALSYGLIGSGTYLHFKAKDSYRNYENATSVDDGNNFLNDAKDEARLAKVFFISGATVWISDIVSVWLRGKKNKNEYNRLLEKKLKPKLRSTLNFQLDYQPRLNSAQVGFNFKF